jgi:pimeloyl-ACP methyl ester carboxylesterase
MHLQREAIREEPHHTRSSVVFIHGFPDSPLMFDAYVTPEELDSPWLRGRNVYRIALPNRHTNPNWPSIPQMARGVMTREFKTLMDGIAEASPTGQMIPIAHDWGATYTWRYIKAGAEAHIERLIALSVGSSFRFDLWEHGLRALGWNYTILFVAGWYLRIPAIQKMVSTVITQGGGYRSPSADQLWRDSFHYWYALPRLLATPFWLVGIGSERPYTDFPFPVVYIRSQQDRIASTAAFERALKQRSDCAIHIWDDVNHWFPEQHAERVKSIIRPVLAEGAPS